MVTKGVAIVWLRFSQERGSFVVAKEDKMADQALSDVKVLDLTQHFAGPYCTKMLADFGADVIKIERPGEGDPSRRMGPFLNDEPHPEKSGIFLHLNTNKRSITLNLKTATGRNIFKELMRDVDILVENFGPGVMEELGLGYEVLEEINPKLIMTRISYFGQSGPYKDYKGSDIIAEGMGGPLYMMGLPDREPVKYGDDTTLFGIGNYAAAATMVALFVAEHQGFGQVVDFGIMEALQSCVNWQLTMHPTYQYKGAPVGRETTAFGMLPTGGFPCKDGWVYMIVDPGWWPKLVAMMEMPELMEKFSNVLDATKKDEFDAIFYPWLLERTKKELHEMAGSVKLNVGAINTMEDVLNDRHYNERGAFAEIDHPVVGKLTYPGRPFTMTETNWEIKRPAPLLGQHNEEVYGKLGYTREDLVRLREAGVI